MAASILTFFCDNPMQSGASAGLLDTVAPTASTSTTGWTVGKTSTSFSFSSMIYGTEQATGTFTGGGPGLPRSAPIQVNGHWAEDCWRTASVLTGVFSAGTWYSSASVISVTAAASGAGNMRWRIWRTSRASGAVPTEITKFSSNSCLIGSTVTAFSTTVAKSSSASTQVASFSVSGEYLFLQCAWQIRTASGSNSADILWRIGPGLTTTDGSGLITSAFSDTTPAPSGAARPGYLLHHYYRDIVEGNV